MVNEIISVIRLGREVVDDGRLRSLREKLGLSLNLMSELFHVSQITYARWERGQGGALRPSIAEKIGRFYEQTTEMLTALASDGVEVENLIPFHLAAAAAGIPNELLMSRYRAGEFDAADLGILGLWVHRRDLHKLGIEDP